MNIYDSECESTCADCRFHRDSADGAGQCRATPPDQIGHVPLGGLAAVMTYRRTADDCPACGMFRPAREPEAPPAETKAEKIERMRREGTADLAAIKRVLDGR
jgi:hypothetical protein